MTVTWLDRAIGTVAPRAGLRRILRRQAFEEASRVYAGADKGRMTEGWRATGTSADAEISIALPVLRDRSRDLTRNNPHAAKALTSWVNNVIGDGIMPRPVTGNPNLDRIVKDLFDEWVEECDAEGQLDYYGIQQLACREMVEAGEVLARRRLRRSSDGLTVPLQVQLLESDHLDTTKHGAIGNGRTANQGIEFNAIGQRTAYWLYASHPGGTVNPFGGLESRAVPASEIVHLYEKQRTQVRGVPWCTPAMRPLRDLQDYELAEIVRKRTESCIVGIVTSFDEEQEGIAPRVTDANGNLKEKFEPGMIAYARGGKEIKFNTPGSTGGYADYKKSMLMTIAAGYRLPYELLTGDLSQVNYSSIRAGLVEYRRLVKSVQWQIVIPMFCQPVFNWFVDAAKNAGLIPVDVSVPVEWSMPKFEWVDPSKDVNADIDAIRAGIRTMPEVLSERGRNVDDVLGEIAEFNAKADALGLKFDTDPRSDVPAPAMEADEPVEDDESEETDSEESEDDDRRLKLLRIQ